MVSIPLAIKKKFNSTFKGQNPSLGILRSTLETNYEYIRKYTVVKRMVLQTQEKVWCDSVGPLGIFQWVSGASYNTGLSENGRFCPGDNCIDGECG